MRDPSAPPSAADLGALRRAVTAFADAGYREDEVCRLAGCGGWTELRRWGTAALRHRLRRFPDPLAELVALYVLGQQRAVPAVRRSLGEAAVDALVATGLLAREGDGLRASVSMTPFEGLLFTSDLRERHDHHAADFVLGPGGVARQLADLTLRRPVGSALDLGCGAGVLAATLAAHADRVVATDVNARAVAFTRFNAAFNGLELDCRCGSLFEPVAGERFDLILCDPPYVISPGETYVYRDGGTELSRAIVRQAPEHLTDVGTLQMLAEWPEVDDDDWAAEVRTWLDGLRCDAWVLRTHAQPSVDYVARWLFQEYPRDDAPQEVFDGWVAYLDERGISSVGGGLVVLQPSTGSAPIRVFRKAPRIIPPSGASMADWLAAQKLLAGLEDDEARLLDERLAPAPALVRHLRAEPTGEGWKPPERELRLTTGLSFGARVDPVTAEVVGLLDGARTPREAMAVLAGSYGVPVDAFLSGLPGALRELTRLGILVPVDGSGG